jgi:acyl-CoA dehydrogenase
MGHEFPGRIRDLECRVKRFTAEHIYQAKAVQCRLVHETNKRCTWQPVLREFRARAKAESLWIFPPPKAVEDHGFYLRKYALIAEAMSTTPIGTETINYYTGTIWRLQQLLQHATATVHHYHLPRLLGGEVRGVITITKPHEPGSGPTELKIGTLCGGDEYLLDDRKSWATGSRQEECEITLALACTDRQTPRHGRHSIILVPRDAKGLTIERFDTILATTTHGMATRGCASTRRASPLLICSASRAKDSC